MSNDQHCSLFHNPTFEARSQQISSLGTWVEGDEGLENARVEENAVQLIKWSSSEYKTPSIYLTQPLHTQFNRRKRRLRRIVRSKIIPTATF